MDVLLTALGIMVIVAGLMDMFHTLLHPSGQGRLSRLVLSAVWRVSKATGHRAGSAVGPAAMVAVVLLWVLLQAAGWALIYYPHIPGGFMYSSGINPAAYPDAVEAVYVSVVTLSTLGYGDVVATDPWIRVASPLEALTGFALLTAALTWFTQIYPPLMRRRALALDLKGLADADYAETIGEVEPAIASRVLDSLQADLTKISVDFTQHTEGFYFQESNPDLSLARQLPYALRLRDAAMARSEPAVRSSAQRLSSALDQLGSEIKDDFVGTGEHPGEVFAAYAAEHGQNTRT
ncbi:transporter [Kocuria rosea]|uniref:potassium channel family protein n=1 Tax=Kocuria rosea TaxID=1275 RepID=UPI000D65A0F6|nr:potassium channel family protein [Kocuria rosea]MEB2529283.1 potassium channel family protein [Kocuria rosea]MEB2620014.1 potassium channel family protein [Kocuria rosea]PWF81876.1 transporter [Kocuria rosea]QCY31664.1 two pore domain potassium channel family protein [Kocuria rosea]TQN39080.1 ion channel [Kocuria rosea]